MIKKHIRRVSIILVLVNLVLAGGCSTFMASPTPTATSTETPVPPTPTPVPPTETPIPTPTETLPPLPTDTQLPPPTSTAIPPTSTPSGKPIYIYFIEKNTGGNVGCGDSLVAITTGVYTKDVLLVDIEQALRQLFLYHTEYFGNLYNPLYKSQLSVGYVDYSSGGDRIEVDINGKLDMTDDACDGGRIWAILIATIRQFPGIPGNPDISVNGVGIKNLIYK
jgi:hypothetical protein